MIQISSPKRLTMALTLGLCSSLWMATPGMAQGYRPNSSPTYNSGSTPNLSEATAVLESAVRNLYQKLEPGQDPQPNELIAYADLRVLRLYTGALEVAGWDLEHAANDFSQQDYSRYRYNSQINDERMAQRRERYLSFREAVRNLLLRVRSTAVSVDHQISFCDPRAIQEWRQEVVPALDDTIAATQPLFYDDDDAARYHTPGQQASNNQPNIVPTSSGLPQNAVEVAKFPTFQPYEGKGQGTGRYFEVKAFGGPVMIRKIRFRQVDNANSTIGSSTPRELVINKVIEADQVMYFACNRDRMVNLTRMEIEWENADGRRKGFGSIDLVSEIPNQRR